MYIEHCIIKMYEICFYWTLIQKQDARGLLLKMESSKKNGGALFQDGIGIVLLTVWAHYTIIIIIIIIIIVK